MMSYLGRPALIGLLALAGCGGGEPDLPSLDAGPACKINEVTNGIEICNNRDDDCNGVVDDAMTGGALRQGCSTACGNGTEQCVRGVWQGCTADEPSQEVCNGVDDDCNGQTDEVCDCVHGEQRSCGTDEGACRAGFQQCVDGQWRDNCINEQGPVDEICNNGIDDDCNGRIDEDCQCTEGDTQVCGTDEGVCEAGQIICGADSRWGMSCEGEVAPGEEICNGLDDDCDGEVDWRTATNFGWRADDLETNETCNQAVMLDPAFDGGDWIEVPVADSNDLTTYPSLYPPGMDEDWYSFRAEEGSNGACVPGLSQCAFVLLVQLRLSDPAARDDYEVCFSTSSCGMINGDNLYCSNTGRWNEEADSYVVAIKWGGVCGRDDSRDVNVVVRNKSGAPACGYYQLYARFYYDGEEACP